MYVSSINTRVIFILKIRLKSIISSRVENSAFEGSSAVASLPTYVSLGLNPSSDFD